MPSTRITTPLKWHGGKFYQAKQIIALMPAHHHYVELFAGGSSVLLAKDPQGVSEVVNDLNGDLTNFYRVLQSPKLFERFSRRVSAVPFGRPQWEDASRRLSEEQNGSRVARAVWFFVQNRMSLAGRMTEFTGVTKSRTRGGMNAEVNAWHGAVEGLEAVHRRLRRVLVECRPAVQLMAGHDVAGAVMYADPPYPADTRTAPDVYGEFEMADADHREFLAAADTVKHAKVLVSGYRCPLYDKALRHWNRHEFEVANHAAGGKAKRRMTEVVWCNY